MGEPSEGNVIGSTDIGDGTVANADLADMAGNTIKGRVSTTGAPQDLTPAQARTILGAGGDAGQFMDASGALQAPPGESLFLYTNFF